ncbi:hypothetical protein L202_00574 [Cryptococcus amylolentus CBS 6039]|uniref:Uncharacterized protein n=3 Tax=Cryptococcus TaxID=5206 RepID=A0A1E3I863_9TREE|nr:hypothetical protein L202_00574 [Cryptococcus amylolentus CBS 6039]ODN84678.1 hypothetical protein L202_00574 [Cryptococcus amylolentus CBS 6039]ODO11573.1 hypothetical protein I350_00354 [Cryptococcus amylolentus CBS 6273]TYJ57188.1 hypothetical protein B9479_002103 [Cryptococcus floricola]
MEGQIDNAKKFLNSDEGKGVKEQLFGGSSGNDQNASYDAQGNKGAEGQFGQQGQFGAVTGGGFGGGLAKNAQGEHTNQGQRDSPYEGIHNDDSTSSGGYGQNAQGGAFSRQNQLGADNHNNYNPGGVSDDNEGSKTGYSTPGYRREDEDEEQLRARNQNVYGQQSDERGSKDNDYHEI